MWKLNVPCLFMRNIGTSLFLVMFRVEIEFYSEKSGIQFGHLRVYCSKLMIVCNVKDLN